MKLRKKNDLIKSISAKDVWKNEETNRIEEKFMSPFIVEHLDEISNITGYDLEMTNMELFVGDFRADIVCKDNNTNDVIIIENQLGQTDHDHIGKAFTYLANLNAKAIIWISEKARPEHIKAVEWFNENTPDDCGYWLLELKFEQYNTDDPYYSFNTIVGQSNINKLANQIKNKSENFIATNVFFEKFINDLKTSVPSTKIINGKTYHKLYTKGALYAWIKRPNNKFVIEIGYDESKLSEKLNKDVYFEKFNSIKNELKTKYNYDTNYEIGKKNSNLHKLILSVDFNDNDIEEYKIICTNIYKVLSQIW